MIAMDENAKAPKVNTSRCLVAAQLYKTKGTKKVFLGQVVLVILIRDIFQPRPVIHTDTEESEDIPANPFIKQIGVSMFARLLEIGASYVYFIEQMRCVLEINNLLVELGYNSITTHPSVATRPSAIKTIEVFKKWFGNPMRIHLINVGDSTHETQDGTHSIYNNRYTSVAFFYAIMLLKQGYKPEEIVMQTPYIA